MSELLLKAEQVSKVFTLQAEEVNAVRNVNFEIRAGDFISVMGPSGSGKTTLLDSLGCLTEITSGKLQVFGIDISHGSEKELLAVRRKNIGFVFQDFLLIHSLSALENVLLPLYFAGLRTDPQIGIDLLTRVGLQNRVDHLPSQLSGGEKQRVAVARALVTRPKILFADEPTGNLDSKSSQEIFNLLRELNETEGLTIFLVTHNPDLAKQTKKIVYYQDGKFVDSLA